jgi:nitroreductase
MDTYLAIASLRVVREYSDRPIPEAELRRILEAGRVTGSAQNRQGWKFYVLRDRNRLKQLSQAVFEPGNIAGCQLAIGMVSTTRGAFDIGRCVQNMALAAWNMGIGSSPNGAKDEEGARSVLGVGEGESLVNILSCGYPLHPVHPREDDVEGIVRRIKRKPLEEIVVWVD